jgi:hypothetical protein
MVNRENPERVVINTETLKETQQRIRKILEWCRDYLRQNYPNLVIDDSLRIDPAKFITIINKNEIDQDLNEVSEREQQFQEKKPIGIDFSSGEVLEIYKTALLNKILSQDYVIVRTSKYDDYFNGVDNIILDKNTGEVIAAIDDIADTMSQRFITKKKNIINRNLNKGGVIKYGLSIDKESKEIIITKYLEGIPIIYIALDEKHLYKLVEQFDNPEIENKFIEFVINLIQLIISEIDLKKNLVKGIDQEEINKRLENLKRLVKSLEQRQKELSGRQK